MCVCLYTECYTHMKVSTIGLAYGIRISQKYTLMKVSTIGLPQELDLCHESILGHTCTRLDPLSVLDPMTSRYSAISLKSSPANATSGGLTIQRSRQATDPVAYLTVKTHYFSLSKHKLIPRTHTSRMYVYVCVCL